MKQPPGFVILISVLMFVDFTNRYMGLNRHLGPGTCLLPSPKCLSSLNGICGLHLGHLIVYQAGLSVHPMHFYL